MKANKTLEFRLTAGDLDVYDHLTPYTISKNRPQNLWSVFNIMHKICGRL